MDSLKPLDIFNYVMVAFYFVIGTILLFVPDAIGLTHGWQNTSLGVLLIVYGFFRGYVAYNKRKPSSHDVNKVLSILLFVVMSSSCTVNQNASGAWSNRDSILVCTDETVKQVMQSGFEVFNIADTLSVMKMEFYPEEVAIGKLLDCEATLVTVSRKLTKNEINSLTEKKRVAKTIKIATDAIAVITHNTNVDSILTVSDIRKILTGEFKNWKEVSKTNKDLPIRVIFDNMESGIVGYMSDSVCGGQKFTDKAFAMEYNADVVNYVSKNPDAIGFIGASWISDPNDTLHLSFHKKIQVVAIAIGEVRSYDDSYKPYQAYMRDKMYAFTRDIYMINIEPKDGKATRFANFMAGQRGQRLILKSGILPANTPTRIIQVRSEL